MLFGGTVLDASDRPTRYNYTLALWQAKIERGLADRVCELAVRSYRGGEVIGFVQDDAGVSAELSGGRALRSRFLVGCDGGRSLLRKTAGIDFPGWEPTLCSLIFKAAMAEEPVLGMR